MACHANYDAACQLNLGSGEGAARGATKVPVYDGQRRQAAAPTRLFYDAFGKRAWEQKDFYSVLDAQGSQAAEGVLPPVAGARGEPAPKVDQLGVGASA